MKYIFRSGASTLWAAFQLAILVQSIDIQYGVQTREEAPPTIVEVTFPSNSKNDSHLVYKKTLPDLTSVTVCFRVKMTLLRNIHQILSYSVPGSPQEMTIAVDADKQKLLFWCCPGNGSMSLKLKLSRSNYISVCFAQDFLSGNWLMATGLDVQSGSQADSPSHVKGDGFLTLGKSAQNGTYNFTGTLADFLLFDIVLPESEMSRYSSCEDMIFKLVPLIDFNSIHNDFEVNALATRELTLTRDFCIGGNDQVIIIPHIYPFQGATNLCQRFGGRIYVPMNEDDNQSFYNESLLYADQCQSLSGIFVWIGILRDAYQTDACDTWYNYHTREKIEYSGFIKTTNNYCNAYEQCALMRLDQNDLHGNKGEWTPATCEERHCTSCLFPTRLYFHLRGLCSTARIDRTFHIAQSNGELEFMGKYFSKIVKVQDKNGSTYWEISPNDFSSSKLVLHTHYNSYPLGIKTWHGNICGISKIKLLLTICTRQQYTCDDGNCIDIEKRCDKKTDCLDQSDEVNCSILKPLQNYNKNIPPPSNNSNSLTLVRLKFELLIIQRIDISESTFDAQAILRVSWNDSRLLFKNLKEQVTSNQVYAEDQIWLPVLDIMGSSLTSSNKKIENTALRVKRLTSPLKDKGAYVREDLIYLGTDNPLLWTMQISFKIYCQYDLFPFPFDVQYCEMMILAPRSMNDVIKLEMNDGDLIFRGNRQLHQYDFTDWALIPSKNSVKNLYTIRLRFTNHAKYFIISTMLPTLIIFSIGYLTFYFPVEDFGNRIMVALTSLMVEAAFFTQITESIPKTSYVKLVDLWFISCVIGLFIIIILLIIINRKIQKTLPIQNRTSLSNTDWDVIPVRTDGRLFQENGAKDPSNKWNIKERENHRMNWTHQRISLIAKIALPLTFLLTFTFIAIVIIINKYNREKNL